METLQGLAQVMTILEARDVEARVAARLAPFDAMGTAGKPVAAAFAVAHDIAEVWAALRFHKRMGGGDYTAYLMGCHLRYWQDRDYEIGELAFVDLRGRAQDWLEAQS
jgi:hypothetical protein